MMKTWVILLGFVAFVKATSYESHRLVRLEPTKKEQYDILKHLHESTGKSVNFWNFERVYIGKNILVDVGPEAYQGFISNMTQHNIKHRVTIPDIRREIIRQRYQNEAAGKNPENFLDVYRTYSEIMTWMSDTVRVCGTRCTMYTNGNSHEGRPVNMIKITGDGTATKSIYLDAGVHTSEWIAIAVTVNLINELVNNYGTNPEIRAAVDKFDFYIVPIANPDGYVRTWDTVITEHRLWGKTVYPYAAWPCQGADMNRNFGVMWSGPGSSNDPCAGTYHGPSSFSEVETQHIRNVIQSLSQNITGYISMHSFGQAFFHPYSYSSAIPVANQAEQVRVGQAAAAAIRVRYGTTYIVDNPADVLYAVGGSSMDWAYDIGQAAYAYIWENRDLGDYGFLIPPEQIRPTSLECLDALLAMAREMRR